MLAGLPPPRSDADFWRTVQQYTLNNAHYYCETADLSRPFPSVWCVAQGCARPARAQAVCPHPRPTMCCCSTVDDPNPEFVWNSWLRQPMLELGLFYHAPALLQVCARARARREQRALLSRNALLACAPAGRCGVQRAEPPQRRAV